MTDTILTATTTLNNGVKMPRFGLGVFQVADSDAIAPVAEAIKAGYRAIDTAQIYGNEAGVGEGIRQGLAATGLDRKDLFITSKVWNHTLTYEDTIRAYEESLAKLGLEYLDLYLIHWPGDQEFLEPWRALEDLYLAGKIKAIGVSNFQSHHLKTLLETARITPAIDQVELHPFLDQHALRAFCNEQKIQIEAWSPLMQGQALRDQTILAIAENYQKSAAQIILRWHYQQDIVVIPKSVQQKRIIENAAIDDFILAPEDIAAINALNQDTRVGPDPDTFFFA